MTVDTVYGDTTDGYVGSNNATYSTARSGANQSALTTGDIIAGQANASSVYYCYEGFLQFNTSVVGTDIVSAAVLSVVARAASAVNFTLEARVKDWGTGLTTADWVAGASLSGLALVAHYATASGWTSGTYYDFVDDALPVNIVNGQTKLLIDGSRHVAGNAPGAGVNEYVGWRPADFAGTTVDPKLTITHAPAASDVLVQPAAAVATVGTSTAAIVAQNWPKALPAAAAIIVAAATPAVGTPVSIAPGAAAVAVAMETPGVWLPVSVAPGAAAVGITGATPAVVAWALVRPGAAEVGITAATPAVSAVATALVQPGAAALAIAAATPAIAATQTYVPSAAAITIGTAAVAVAATQTYMPVAATITITTATPVAVALSVTLVQPATAAMTITTAAPDVNATASWLTQPAAARMLLRGAVPLISSIGTKRRAVGGGGQVQAFGEADDEDVLLALFGFYG